MIAWWLACSAPEDPTDSGPEPLPDDDHDGFSLATDCDDEDPAVNPGAADTLGDGLDADCDGTDVVTRPLADTARLIVFGENPGDALGETVACASAGVGPLGSAIGAGADQSWSDSGDGRGYAVVFDGTDAGVRTPFDAAWRGVGTQHLDLFGHRVVFPGDVDGDGDGDLLITAVSAYRPGNQTGAAFLFDVGRSIDGSTDDAGTWFSDEPGAQLGGAAPAGDLDGDGRADLVLSATYWGWGIHPGEIRAYRGGALDARVAPDAAWIRVAALEPTTPTGESLAVAELTGDAEPDLVFGEYEWEGRGRVAVVPGPVADWPTHDPILLSGVEDRAVLGTTVATGDLSGDGVGDLAVSAFGAAGGGDHRGAVYVWFGPLAADRTTDDADLVIRGETDHALFGIPTILDHDGDGALDLAVAAPSDDRGGAARPGLVYVFSGPLGAGEVAPTAASVVYAGVEPNDQLGASLAGCDLDHDGDDELVIGAPGDAYGEARRGRVFVVDGG